MPPPYRWMTFLPLLLALGLCAGIVRGQSGTETESHVNESIARLVRDLGSDDYESRVAATERLEQFGRAAVDPVTQAAKDGELEVAIRAIAVLQHLAIAEDEPTADAATRALETLHRLNNRSLSWRAGHALNFVRHWAELAIESIGGRVSTERGENGELVAQIKLEGLSGGKLAPLQRRALKKFQVLVVAGGKVTDAEVEFLADLETLAHLDVRYTQIGDKTLTRLRPGLKKLLLSGTRVSDAGLADVRRLKELRVLYLSGNEITDAGIAHVATLPQLEELNLSQCKAVTDEGAARLARVESLKHLNLTGTQVGDEGLRRLAEVAGLEGLYLHGTRVTDEGVAQFRAARPNCRVRH